MAASLASSMVDDGGRRDRRFDAPGFCGLCFLDKHSRFPIIAASKKLHSRTPGTESTNVETAESRHLVTRRRDGCHRDHRLQRWRTGSVRSAHARGKRTALLARYAD